MLLNRLQSKFIDSIIREEYRANVEARDDADLVLRRAALDESSMFESSIDDVDTELCELAEGASQEINKMLEAYRAKALKIIKSSSMGRQHSLVEMRQFLADDQEALNEAKTDAEFTVQCALHDYGRCLAKSLQRTFDRDEEA